MRVPTSRFLGAFAIGGALVSSTACGVLPGTDSNTSAACKNMKAEIESIPSRAMQQISNPAAAAQVYADSANKIRSQGKSAGGDVEEAGNQVAADLDDLANTLRSAASGTPRVPDSSRLTASSVSLQNACN